VRAAIAALLAEVEALRQEVDQARTRLSDLDRLADQNPLTSIANRRAFVGELSRFIAAAERYGTPSSVIYFDLNGLKAINDTHGHAAGDEALVRVATILRENVRESDVVGRLGGDEFGVILCQSDQPAGIEKARALDARVKAQPIEIDGQRIAIEAAFGVYTIGPGVSAKDALAAADRAMYDRKHGEKRPAGPGDKQLTR